MRGFLSLEVVVKSRVGLRWCLTSGVPLMKRGQFLAAFGAAMKTASPRHRADHRCIQQGRGLEAVAASRLQRLAEAVPVDLAEL